MKQYAKFNEDGFPVAFYSEGLLGLREVPVFGEAPEPTEENPFPAAPVIGYQRNPNCIIPDDAIAITDEQHAEFVEFSGLRRWENGDVVEYMPPVADPVTILPAVTLWERLTEAEAEQVDAAMATQPFRTRQIFLTANTFRSDHELWPLLVQMATDLFGEERGGQLLATA
ncbi:hypothetical protein [Brucella cytisi]|uniref:hypothetical protein n=1 Tax=Brucella cytisi TaxID=407152 RepID=UPI0019810B7F|nr:hypothetical protein [Brucella cytisi]